MKLPEGIVWFGNPEPWVFLPGLLIGGLIGLGLGWIFFLSSPTLASIRVLLFWLSTIVGFGAMFAVFVRTQVIRVGIGGDRILVKKLSGTLFIQREDVASISLNPPVGTVADAIKWWGRTSNLRIEFRDDTKPPIQLNNIPDGVKLRVARALNPERYPGDPLEPARTPGG